VSLSLLPRPDMDVFHALYPGALALLQLYLYTREAQHLRSLPSLSPSQHRKLADCEAFASLARAAYDAGSPFPLPGDEE